MKTKIFLSICLLALVCCITACDDKEKYPIITVVGERTLTGELGPVPMPPFTDPPLPGVSFGFRTADWYYDLTSEKYLISDGTITADGVVYSEGDKVEITGIVTMIRFSESRQYTELEIKTIKKIS